MVALWWKWYSLIVLSARSFRPALRLQRAPRQRPRARQTDRQTDSYSRSDDRPTNRRARVCSAGGAWIAKEEQREKERETAWWNKQEQRLSLVLTSSATEEMIIRIDLHVCTLILLFQIRGLHENSGVKITQLKIGQGSISRLPCCVLYICIFTQQINIQM